MLSVAVCVLHTTNAIKMTLVDVYNLHTSDRSISFLAGADAVTSIQCVCVYCVWKN